jgi:hypothetical protein
LITPTGLATLPAFMILKQYKRNQEIGIISDIHHFSYHLNAWMGTVSLALNLLLGTGPVSAGGKTVRVKQEPSLTTTSPVIVFNDSMENPWNRRKRAKIADRNFRKCK